MSIDVHTDGNNNINIEVQTQQANAEIVLGDIPQISGAIGTTALYGPAGRGIKSISKTSSSGLVDTYTILYTDNTTSTFQITNGQDGIDGYTLTYVHEQGEASDTWDITHNLNKYPSVTLVDTAGTQFQGRVEYIDVNNCTVYMNGATKGKAYLN
jgi:hypothetical protein